MMTDMRTVHLDQFTDEEVDDVLDALEAAGIAHWVKNTGGLTRFLFAGDWGVRIFVDAERLDEAQEIVERVRSRS